MKRTVDPALLLDVDADCGSSGPCGPLSLRGHRDARVVAWYGSPYQPEPAPPKAPPDEQHRKGDLAERLASRDKATLARVGVVLGRFRPPHRGHELLVEEAFARCGWLHIVSPWALEKETSTHHYTAFVWAFSKYGDLHNPLRVPAKADDPAAWADIVRSLDPPVTHLFSSDPGAEPLARALGIEHVLIDPARTRMPISASLLRADLASHFRWLMPAARAVYAFKVGIVGAEGAGKTTLLRELQTLFQASVVEEELRKEAARCKSSGGIPSAAVFERLMQESPALVDTAARQAESGIVITDNDAVSIQTWAYRVGHQLSRRWSTDWDTRKEHRDLWLHCHNDFPFTGERDEPAARASYERALRGRLRWAGGGDNVVDITGEGQARVELAAAAIREHMAAHMKRVVVGL